MDILNDTYNTVDKGVNTIEEIKSGKLRKNINEIQLIEERIHSMKRKFYVLWLAMIVIMVLMFIFI